MSNDGAAYLRLSKKEAKAIHGWFFFQEDANIEDGELSSITPSEIEFSSKLRRSIIKMSKDPERTSIRLSPHWCKLVFNWYENLPIILVDDLDADIHASLGMFLNERNELED